jgi:glycosyltransferase involved in cell wall biosynthesis
MQKIAVIVSLNFNPGHVSHLIASYKQCQDLGYKSVLYIDEQFRPFIPDGFDFIVYGDRRPDAADLAVFTFPSQKNLSKIKYLKHKLNAKIIYIFHEPLEKISVYRKAGFSTMKLIKIAVINEISILTVKLSDIILLPSKKALDLYDSNKVYKNEDRHYLPLMFDDERHEKYGRMPRTYFSYIGTIASDHSFNEFVEFVKYAISEKKLQELNFLIATKSKVEKTDEIIKMLDTGRLTIFDGTPLNDDEINAFYASSFVVWNAYDRTTQSGVLAKSFMFGTPAIVLRKNVSEFVEDGKEVVAIENNKSFVQIEDAISKILDNHQAYSDACRGRFLSTFYYKNYNKQLSQILDSCK